MSQKYIHPEDIIAHAGDGYEKIMGAVVPPIFQNSLFVQPTDVNGVEASGYTYTRAANPTVEIAEEHRMHSERIHISQETIDRIERTKRDGGRVIAVGTTSMRTLESAWSAEEGRLVPLDGASTSLFILPGYEFHVADGLITNFHVPKSTLMMLVSAFAGRESILDAYEQAVANRYRMLSFGDAMLII